LLQVDAKDFQDELAATLGRESVCKRYFELLEKGNKLQNHNNSALGYVMGITDELPKARPPIWYDSELPDIDVDFSDVRRDMVFKYAEEKYGSDHVARLGTVGLFRPASALNQVGASLQIPKWMVERTLESVTERSSGDSRAMLTLEDAMNASEAGRLLVKEYPEAKLAARMEGHPNNSSQHAAGIVITEQPLIEYIGVDSRVNAAQCDKKDAEELNLLKIDALGLTQLSIFERTLQLIGKPDITGYLETIPLNDPKAFEVLNNGKFSGIFQFTGQALKSLVKQITVEKLDDMVAITALARPGPLATGGASSWVRRRVGAEEIKTKHPAITELTKNTLGIFIYQEQIMEIVRQIGNFSWEETSAVRKAMSGRLGDEYFEKFKLKFIEGAMQNGIEEKIAADIWSDINKYGSWSFNLSHAVAYGIVSYQCCFLKAYHPYEFAAATLDAENNPLNQIAMLRELAAEGVNYVPVDPSHSTDRWSFKEEEGRRVLVGPLTNIKGIGPKTCDEILSCREKGLIVRAALQKRLDNAVTPIDSLYPIADTVHRMYPDIKESLNIHTKPTQVKNIVEGKAGSVMIIGVIKKIAPRDENDAQKVTDRVQRARERGMKTTGLLSGPTQALNLFVADDTDEIFCKVDRYNFEKWGKAIIERGKPGKAIYAIKGTVPEDFRMIKITAVRYIGDIGGEAASEEKK